MKKFGMLFLCFLTLVLQAGGSTIAESASKEFTGDEKNWCRFFPADWDGYHPATVTGTITGKASDRAYFYNDYSDATCPSLTQPQCRDKSYLIPGDPVLVRNTYQQFSCVIYQPKKGVAKTGFVPTARLRSGLPAPTPALSQWVGKWRYYDNYLDIHAGEAPGTLRIEGEAFWHGLGDNVHIGSVGGSGKPVGGVLKISEGNDDYSCHLTIRLVNKILIADDDSNCGGANVRFNGIYRK